MASPALAKDDGLQAGVAYACSMTGKLGSARDSQVPELRCAALLPCLATSCRLPYPWSEATLRTTRLPVVDVALQDADLVDDGLNPRHVVDVLRLDTQPPVV